MENELFDGELLGQSVELQCNHLVKFEFAFFQIRLDQLLHLMIEVSHCYVAVSHCISP